MDKMTSCKPYLVRALYEWILDNQCTPYLLVDADYPMVQVPREYVKQGQIVLNAAPQSTGNFTIGETEIEFNARFGGQPRHIIVPIEALLFIYSKETGEGMPFPPEERPDYTTDDKNDVVAEKKVSLTLEGGTQTDDNKTAPLAESEKTDKEQKKSRNHLKVIK